MGVVSEGSDNGMIIVGENVGMENIMGMVVRPEDKCAGQGWGANAIVNSLLQHQSATGASLMRKKIMKKFRSRFISEIWGAHATMNTWAAPLQPVGLQGSNGSSNVAMILSGVAVTLGAQTILPIVIKEVAEVNDAGVTRVQIFLA